MNVDGFGLSSQVNPPLLGRSLSAQSLCIIKNLRPPSESLCCKNNLLRRERSRQASKARSSALRTGCWGNGRWVDWGPAATTIGFPHTLQSLWMRPGAQPRLPGRVLCQPSPLRSRRPAGRPRAEDPRGSCDNVVVSILAARSHNVPTHPNPRTRATYPTKQARCTPTTTPRRRCSTRSCLGRRRRAL